MNWDLPCDKVQKLLSSYVDRELSYDEERRVALHVDGCLRCAKELEQLRSLKDLLSSVPSRDLPGDFWPELRAKLAGEPAGTRDISRIRRGTWFAISTRRPWFTIPGSNRLRMAVAAAALPLVFFMTAPLIWSIVSRPQPVEIAPFLRTHALSAYRQPWSDDAWINYMALESQHNPGLTPVEQLAHPDASVPGGSMPTELNASNDDQAAVRLVDFDAQPWGILP